MELLRKKTDLGPVFNPFFVGIEPLIELIQKKPNAYLLRVKDGSPLSRPKELNWSGTWQVESIGFFIDEVHYPYCLGISGTRAGEFHSSHYLYHFNHEIITLSHRKTTTLPSEYLSNDSDYQRLAPFTYRFNPSGRRKLTPNTIPVMVIVGIDF